MQDVLKVVRWRSVGPACAASVVSGLATGALSGCGTATPSAPPAVLLEEPGDASGGAAGVSRRVVDSAAIYPAGPAIFRGTRFDERDPDAPRVSIELRRSADDADGIFTDTLVLLEGGDDDGEERLARTNRFRRDASGGVVLLATTNHERVSTATYQPPLVGAGPAGVDGDGVATMSDVTIDGNSAGEAEMRVVYVGDEMVDVAGQPVRTARLETTFVLRPRPAVRVERSFVRWIGPGATGSMRTVRERTHEVIRAGPITVSERKFVDVWE